MGEQAEEHTLAAKQRQRIEEVDLFRGFVIIAMYMANNMGAGLPQWMYHASGKVPYITWVDFVAPAFLWITGVAIPFAMQRRIKQGDSEWKNYGHIFWRGILLLWIGSLFDSWTRFRFDLMPIIHHLTTLDTVGDDGKPYWTYYRILCVYRMFSWFVMLGICTHWAGFKFEPGSWKARAAKSYWVGSLITMIVLLFVVRYGRGAYEGTILEARGAWDTKGWGLPGSVISKFGWAFLWIGPIWMLTRKNLYARIGLLGFSLLAISHSKAGGFFGSTIPMGFLAASPFDRYGFAILAGTIVGDVLLGWKNGELKPRSWFSWMSGLMIAGAFMVEPQHGWTVAPGVLRHGLFVAGFCVAALWLVWEVNRCGWLRYIKKPVIALGQNPLFAFFLPFMVVGPQWLFGFSVRDLLYGDISGWVGLVDPIMWTVVYTALVMLANKYKLYWKV